MTTIECNGVTFPNVEAILFDKDGTLADSQGFLRYLGEKRAALIDAEIPGVYPAILKVFGIEETPINLAGTLAIDTRETNEIQIATLLTQTGLPFAQARSLVQTAFLKADKLLPPKASLTPIFGGILPLLESLKSLKLGILSSDREENVREFVDRYDLAAYFTLQMGARPGISKPNPQLLALACQNLEVSPKETLVIGDSVADIKLAHQGNAIGAIGVTWGGVTIPQLKGADAIAHQPIEIQLAMLD